jgi:hypothetical protein
MRRIGIKIVTASTLIGSQARPILVWPGKQMRPPPQAPHKPVVAAERAAFVHFKQMPKAGPWAAIGLRIYWVFLIGVIVAGAFRLFAVFTAQPASVGIFLFPLCLALAEVIHLLIDGVLARFGRSRRP